jgi:hypothetical protein
MELLSNLIAKHAGRDCFFSELIDLSQRHRPLGTLSWLYCTLMICENIGRFYEQRQRVRLCDWRIK